MFVLVRSGKIGKIFGGDETVTPPYMAPIGGSSPDYFSVTDDLQTSTLADYLGVPTVITGTYGAVSSLDLTTKGSVVKTISVGTEKASAPLSGYVASSIKSFSELQSFINSSASFGSYPLHGRSVNKQ